MTTTMNNLDIIDRELARASAPRPTGSKKPLLLFLKEEHKALIRPLVSLRACLLFAKHSKWSDDRAQRVNAICAMEDGKECAWCEASVHDKKLIAGTTFYLPVYVYGILDQSTNTKVTYKERGDNDKEIQVDVKGIRLLELTAFGAPAQILKYFRNFPNDPDNGEITGRDFTIEQSGSGQKKAFLIVPKDKKPLDPRLIAATPLRDALRTRILEALPPLATAAENNFNRNNAIGEIMDDLDAVTPVQPQSNDLDEIPEF